MQTLTVNVLVHSKLSLPVGLLLSVWLKGEGAVIGFNTGSYVSDSAPFVAATLTN